MLLTGVPQFLEGWWDDRTYSWEYAAAFSLLTVQAWGWIVAALSVGMRVPAFQRPMPRTIAQAAMPFFIVHQPVILFVAYYVVRWDAGIPGKLTFVFLLSFVVSAALAWLLSRIPVISLLFGAKRRMRQRADRADVRH